MTIFNINYCASGTRVINMVRGCLNVKNRKC